MGAYLVHCTDTELFLILFAVRKISYYKCMHACDIPCNLTIKLYSIDLPRRSISVLVEEFDVLDAFPQLIRRQLHCVHDSHLTEVSHPNKIHVSIEVSEPDRLPACMYQRFHNTKT